MDFFDNHCDTLVSLLEHGENMQNASGQISLKKAAYLQRWAQLFALFVHDSYTGKGAFPYYLKLRDLMQAQLMQYSHKIMQCRTAAQLDEAFAKGKCALIATVENGNVLEGKLENLIQLEQDGIKLLTLAWYGENELGFGSKMGGALKPFGKEVLRALPQHGIIPDISHLSDEGVKEVFACYEGPVVASHSNVRSVTPHFRNLKNEQITAIIAQKGIIGINFYTPFLTQNEIGTLDDVYRHIDAFLSLGAEDTLCFGTDFDGVGAQLPPEIGDIGGMKNLYEFLLQKGLTEALLQKLFFDNAFRFWHAQLT